MPLTLVAERREPSGTLKKEYCKKPGGLRRSATGPPGHLRESKCHWGTAFGCQMESGRPERPYPLRQQDLEPAE